MPVIKNIANMKEEMATWRHELHQYPQTAYEEIYAADFVAKKLTEWNIPFKRGYGKTGIAATIEGKKTDSGKAIALRADLDALDIEEETGLDWASRNPGKMHACGHDGHTTTLLGAAKHMSETRNFNGRVQLIFQPAEENAGGALAMIEDGLFEDFPCDYVFGFHNWPELPAGKIAMRTGTLTASADQFEITIIGVGGHDSTPQLTVDPIVVAAYIVTALQGIVSRNLDPADRAAVGITNLNSGDGAFNIIPETAKLKGTVRTFDDSTMETIKNRIEEISRNVAAAFGAGINMKYRTMTKSTVNSADGVEFAAAAAAQIIGAENVITDCPASMGGEDFGAFLNKKPGAFVFIGQNIENDLQNPHSRSLHSPHYDYNDNILPIGASYFTALAESILK